MANTNYTDLQKENILLRDQVGELLDHIKVLQQERDSLKVFLAKLQRMQFGSKSEKCNPAQLMLDLETEARDREQVALPEHQFVAEAPDAEQAGKKIGKRSHPGRNKLPDHLPRQRIEIHPAPEQCVCSCCQKPMKAIGEEISEHLGRMPAKFFVRQCVRIKYACPDCQEAVVRPELPARAIDKGSAGEDVLADVLVSKYSDHLPLHRQSQIYKRDGVHLNRSTLCEWVDRCSDLLAPIVEQMRQDVLSSRVIQSDDTPIKYQDVNQQRKTRRGYLWSYVGDHGDVVYDFTTSRGQSAPAQFLAGFSGVLQVDGYAGYNEILSQPGVEYLGCWAHARRKFYEARDTSPVAGANLLLMIKSLYKVEQEAREQNLKPPEVAALRTEKSLPTLQKIEQYLRDLGPEVLPKSPLGQAISYTLNRWDALRLYVTDGQLEIDNNSCELSMRRVAVGRKNWLFAGSVAGGERAAVIYSLTETCNRLGINPHEYLTDVLRRVSTHPNRRISELTPSGWLTCREAGSAATTDTKTTATENE